jgi:transketolase
MINPANIKLWSRIGSRAAFGMIAVELGKEDRELLILTADVSTSAGLERFKKNFPDQFVDIGIAEQNMMGVAAGLASEGAKVITATFAPFQTMRCCEQIRVNLGYMRHKVVMVGLASGVALGNLGYTHCCIEDISIMRSIPGITVLSPADCGETVKAVIAALGHNESVYVRLTGGMNNPIVYSDDYEFNIGKAITLRDGTDITILATGTMVYEALEAAKKLEADHLSVAVINMHTIKPIDLAAVNLACVSTQLVVTAEEHSIIGGLGSAIAEIKTTLKNSPPQLIIGLPDAYDKAGEYKHLLERHGLTAAQMAEKIKKYYKAYV